MKSTFVDSFHFIAILNRNDLAHQRAIDAIRMLKGRLVTTEFVLLEVADAFADPNDRPALIELIARLRANSMVDIEPASSELWNEGLDLFCRRPDKAWSLTDCTSFVVMTRDSIREALTGDRHFEQAGFVALLK